MSNVFVNDNLDTDVDVAAILNTAVDVSSSAVSDTLSSVSCGHASPPIPRLSQGQTVSCTHCPLCASQP